MKPMSLERANKARIEANEREDEYFSRRKFRGINQSLKFRRFLERFCKQKGFIK